jgi:hypothetical protein
MKRRTMTALKWALALAVVLAMTGTGWAKKPTFAPSLDGQFKDAARTMVDVLVPIPQCTDSYTASNGDIYNFSYSLEAYIFQPSGRILAIGFYGPSAFDCASNVDVTITAVQGLSFKPGPATLLYKVTETEDVTTTTANPDPTLPPITSTTTTITVHQYGATINIHP